MIEHGLEKSDEKFAIWQWQAIVRAVAFDRHEELIG